MELHCSSSEQPMKPITFIFRASLNLLCVPACTTGLPQSCGDPVGGGHVSVMHAALCDV